MLEAAVLTPERVRRIDNDLAVEITESDGNLFDQQAGDGDVRLLILIVLVAAAAAWVVADASVPLRASS